MTRNTIWTLAALLCAFASQSLADQITFYEGEGFRGRVFTTHDPVANFSNYGFNDRASSVIVDSGKWEACEDTQFGGYCTLLRPGSYDSLQRMGMNNRISSVRPASYNRHSDFEASEPLPAPTYQYRRRPEERLDEARVLTVHAVVGPPEQRCWVERERVVEPNSGPNIGGAIVGAVIGGVLGHQIGGGRGRDIATVGGAAVGGTIGANAGTRGSSSYDQDVRRCDTVPSARPAYWDVTYDYHGIEHRVQMTSPPGATVLVNHDGDPRS